MPREPNPATCHYASVNNSPPSAERTFWRSIEATHASVYFSPGAGAAYKALGLRGYWSGYFASRSAALGQPSARVVTSLFYGFAPDMVARAIPEAWALADVSAILDTRMSLAREALSPFVADLDIEEIASALEAATGVLDFSGAPLAAAQADIAIPEDPLGRLWRAATILREYRGDIHLCVLRASGLSGAESNALQVAYGALPERQQANRGFTDEHWAEAQDALVRRGWLDAEKKITALGREQRDEIESLTDDLTRSAAPPLIDSAPAKGLAELAKRIRDAKLVPRPPHDLDT
ncbi:MAG: hypothetical protein JWP10_1278 [Nocardioidaceae bacterium]|nr:hypothetical protein [Nocardioidaceae bacterium]